MSHGWRASVVWKPRAVPWNEPTTVAGTPILAETSSRSFWKLALRGRVHVVGQGAGLTEGTWLTWFQVNT